MRSLEKIGINELQYLVNYFFQNKNNIERVVIDFGDIKSDNGHGTFFLKPINPLFKVFWIHCNNGRITSIGFGGRQLGLLLIDLYSVYGNHNEGFSRYDDEYIYVFYSSEDYNHTIKVTSSEKLFEDGNIINNIPINGIEITLR